MDRNTSRLGGRTGLTYVCMRRIAGKYGRSARVFDESGDIECGYLPLGAFENSFLSSFQRFAHPQRWRGLWPGEHELPEALQSLAALTKVRRGEPDRNSRD